MPLDDAHHTFLNDEIGEKRAEEELEASSPQSSTPAELVDAINLVFGKQTYNRAIHAKGIVLEGRFLPSPSAAALSKAPHFQNAAVPVTVRFSDFAGIPTISDTDDLANPRGMAVKFHLPDGSETDLVIHSFNGFPSATTDEFRELLIAIGSSGPGAATPTPADTYLATHPVAKSFLESQQPPPVSYATLTYFGVNSYKFTNAQDQVVFGRYRIEPEEGNQFLSAEEIEKASPDYLADEIRQRLARAPVKFDLRVQISEPGDKIDDPSIAWPGTRRLADIGLIEITKVIPDTDAVERDLLFLPAQLPEGIEPADPMIQFRNAAYVISYGRRHQ
ncbi:MULTISPECIES: catalase family peroxidase [Methanosarcina]|jgi:catalase|uniref:Catalase n=5 Tax=Methanosarcina mazei TaxID=2209 RepID=A0A0F8TZ55_METMZ|nr:MULTISPECIES: catalase family peroxidase [Methanosarcina]AKB40108.1 Catalase [Methanosarcina mazei WWM610]AKB64335.1 Catalase [Methanosarcina mazei S-6]AKB67688.1 Catalase [Methanosarcina mazei LYC]AKB72387.1 Catalase [Methanosarcina mazei C16]KKG01331.1 catalase [Methanosarcina mazei]